MKHILISIALICSVVEPVQAQGKTSSVLYCHEHDSEGLTSKDGGKITVSPKHYPIKLWVDSNFEPEDAKWVHWAAGAWNEALGFKAFAFESLDVPIDLHHLLRLPFKGPYTPITYLHPSDDPDGDTAGLTPFNITPHNHPWGAMVLFKPGMGKAMRVVALHELGHLLGLEHDEDNVLSVMYPVATPFSVMFEKDDLEYVRRARECHIP